MKGEFNYGDHVLLVYDKRRRWIREIEDDQFHCNYGSVDLSELVGSPYGSSIQTTKGKSLKAFPPTIIDWINSFKHKSQIIYEKDAAMINLLLDAKNGDTIYEAGTGSGALTAILARSVAPGGMIITHDNRPEAVDIARKNIANLNLTNIHFNMRDIKDQGFVEGKADGLILDMGDPWEVIDKVTQVLIPGGMIVIFIPTFNQLSKTDEELWNNNFKEIRAIELIEREIQIKKGAIRPATRMIGHTGFLLSARYMG